MWLCQTEEAIEHKRKCKDQFNCDKCAWIDGASEAMCEYGTLVEPDPHPLQDMIIDKFNGTECD